MIPPPGIIIKWANVFSAPRLINLFPSTPIYAHSLPILFLTKTGLSKIS